MLDDVHPDRQAIWYPVQKPFAAFLMLSPFGESIHRYGIVLSQCIVFLIRFLPRSYLAPLLVFVRLGARHCMKGAGHHYFALYLDRTGLILRPFSAIGYLGLQGPSASRRLGTVERLFVSYFLFKKSPGGNPGTLLSDCAMPVSVEDDVRTWET